MRYVLEMLLQKAQAAIFIVALVLAPAIDRVAAWCTRRVWPALHP